MHLVCASEISSVELACSDESGETLVLGFHPFLVLCLEFHFRRFTLPAQLPLACFEPKVKVDSDELSNEAECPALLT